MPPNGRPRRSPWWQSLPSAGARWRAGWTWATRSTPTITPWSVWQARRERRPTRCSPSAVLPQRCCISTRTRWPEIHKHTNPLTPVSAEARCVVTGCRLNKISECWLCRLGLYGIDLLILHTNKHHCCSCPSYRQRKTQCVCVCVCVCVCLTAIHVISDYSGVCVCVCVCVCVFSERVVPHKLFTPLLTGMVATGIFLSLVLVVLLYKYMQVRCDANHALQCH